MTIEGVVEAAGNIVPNTIDAIGRLFPGVALGSADRAKSRSIRRAMDDIENAKTAGAAMGLSRESIEAICSSIAKERVACERFSNVVSFAAELRPDMSKANDIDPSWAEAFRRHAERATDEEAQRAWAAVLAGELETPGSVSKRTMSILADMGMEEAKTFRHLCSTCLGGRLGNGVFVDPMPLMIEIEGMRRMEQKELDALNALGLTDVSLHGITIETNHPFGEDGVLVTPIGGVDYRVERWNATPYLSLSRFTRYGAELSSCCEVGEAPGFREAAISWLEGMGAKVMRIARWNDDGSYDYECDDEKQTG